MKIALSKLDLKLRMGESMDIFTLSFWAISIILFVISITKDKKKTIIAMKKSKSMMKNI